MKYSKERPIAAGDVREISRHSFKRLESERNRQFNFFLKRVIDLLIIVPVAIVLAPLMLLFAVIIKFTDGEPIFFAQKRVGRFGEEFKCYKFRTMVKDASERLDHILKTDPVAAAEWQMNHKLKRDPRVTGFGRFLRKTSLDELPQLWNIIKGEMSLVGPRPIVENEIPKYGKYFKSYVSVPLELRDYGK